jgi:competence protein ComGC
MTRRLNNQRIGGFTLVEVVTVIVVVVVLAGVLLPMLMRPRTTRCGPIGCASRLQQIGLAFRMWSQEHGDKFPWAVSTNEGGTLEFAHTSDVFRHYLSLSNELSSPKVLRCLADEKRTAATSWDQLTSNAPFLSYFAGLNADESRPQTILSGDRNLTTNGRPAAGVITVSSNASFGFTRELHRTHGNIGLADGSAQQVTAADLQKQNILQFQTITSQSVRLAIP